MAHITPSSNLGDYIGTMHLAMYLSIGFSMKIFSFLTLAPCAYVTYYQARGLSGHTSPCDEVASFWQTLLCRKVKWAHFIEKEIFFLKSTMHSSNNRLLRC